MHTERLFEGAAAEGVHGLGALVVTSALLNDSFHWPRLSRDVERFVQRCRVCKTAKEKAIECRFV
jgi:hypothetical protein